MADNTFVNIGGHKVSAGIKYSTSEVKTGDVWIDGKPIYQLLLSVPETSFSKSVSGNRVMQAFNLVLPDNIRLLKVNGYFRINDTSFGTREYCVGYTSISGSLTVTVSACFEFYETSKTITLYLAYADTLDSRFSMQGSSNFILQYIKVN